MDSTTLTALKITLHCASLATFLVMIPGTWIAYVLARRDFPGKNILSAIVGLPLVLPPTAVGYLLLQLLSTEGLLGQNRLGFDLNILLTWKAVTLACAVMSLPLVIRTARVAFEGVDPRLESMARTLGHSRIKTFFCYTLPLAFRGIFAALILGFTRALGEFGATVTIAGNIPGKTQTLASAIFTAQQVGNQTEAYFLLGIALIIGFVAILVSEYLSQRQTQ
ncbi:MAG: molybdate ABC transporter permease subunit [Kiritimatiellae bacterium]|nr:molybdate ABC transporter permease subunit [Kiritimatiellia bacterium]